MRVDESLDRQLSSTLMHSHQLWAGSNFDESQWEVWLVWPVMGVAEASDFQVITHKKRKKKRKYYCNNSDCQQLDKRPETKKKKRGSNEQKQGNRKKKKDSRQLSCNSHCSFDRAMRVEETLMQILACQLSSTLILVWSRLLVSLPRFTTMYFHSIDILMIRWMIVVYQEKNELQVNLKESAWYLIMRDLVWE